VKLNGWLGILKKQLLQYQLILMMHSVKRLVMLEKSQALMY
jgi:hypothetical protein